VVKRTQSRNGFQWVSLVDDWRSHHYSGVTLRSQAKADINRQISASRNQQVQQNGDQEDQEFLKQVFTFWFWQSLSAEDKQRVSRRLIERLSFQSSQVVAVHLRV